MSPRSIWTHNVTMKRLTISVRVKISRVGAARTKSLIDLLAILQKSLDRAIFLYNFIREVRQSGVRASIAIVHIRKFYKL